MFCLFLGRTGSGKSYEMTTHHVLPALQSGRMVVTNLPLNLEAIYSFFPETRGLIKLVHPTKINPNPFTTRDDYIHDWRHPETNQGPLIIIDEAHKSFPKGRTNNDTLEFLAESRHAGVDVYYATQGVRKIDGNVIDLTDLTYRFSKARAFGSTKRYIRKVIDGTRGEVFNESVREYNHAYFKFYQSHTMSNKAVVEAQAKDIKPIWQTWPFIGTALCFTAVIPMAFAGWLNPFPDAPVKPTEVNTAYVHPEPPQQIEQLPAQTADISGPTIAENAAQVVVPKKPEHPYHKVNMHVGASITNYDRQLILIRASQNGQTVFNLTSDELQIAGYEIDVISECSVHLEYRQTGYSEYLTCDKPAQSGATPSIN